jgi:hypothetical protein
MKRLHGMAQSRDRWPLPLTFPSFNFISSRIHRG